MWDRIEQARAEWNVLEARSREEHDHIAMWDGFVEAVGGNVAAEPNKETLECVEVWTREDGFGTQLARLYAVESGQPAISKTKSEGLAAHYDIHDDPGNLYFTVHEEMDVHHAEEGRKLIEKYMNDFSEDQMVAAAEEAFRANWRLLDGVCPS